MTSDSIALVRHLQTLERQIVEAAHHHDALRAATAGSDRGAVQCAGWQAERHLRAMAITTARLKAHVVPADGLGPALESLSELALRAARLVVLSELDTLRALVHEGAPAAVHGPVAWGRFYGVEDLAACVRAALDRITASWWAHRGCAQSDRRAYRASLHEAHAAMRQLGTASEFARFLWEGRSRADWPALQATCSRMSTALTQRIDIAPDQPLVACASPAGDGATERAS